MEQNGFQPPKMAVIRLLRSQGCCPGNDKQKTNTQLDQMLKYKEEL